MNDNENKTNAPTIKLPVRYDGVTECLIDADGTFIAIDIDGDTEHRAATAGQIVAALNEADALRSMLDGAIDHIKKIVEFSDKVADDAVYREVTHNESEYFLETELGLIARGIQTTTAAIKPNAAAGGEGTE
jgi:hypothetical protein